MDNITHSLIGLTQADLTLGKSQNRTSRSAFEKAAIWIAVASNNVPDLDFLIPLTIPGDHSKIGYLLHHRGFTHTFLFALPQACLVTFLFLIIFKIRERKQILKLLAISVLGLCLHLFADSWNEYGVHPWTPFNNQWYAGGFVFIVEPYLWFFILPWLIRRSIEAHAKVKTIGFSALLLGMIGLTWLHSWVPWQAALLATSLLACFAYVDWRTKWASKLSVGTIGIFLGISIILSKSAVLNAVNAIMAREPDSKIIEISSSPAPANPACYRVVTARITSSQDYIAQLSLYSFLPSLIPPKKCMPRAFSERTMPLSPVSATPIEGDGLLDAGGFKAPVSSALALYHSSCTFRAFIKFSRFPYWTKNEAGQTIFGDIRWDNEKRLSFSEFIMEDEDMRCPTWVPPWKTNYASNLDQLDSNRLSR